MQPPSLDSLWDFADPAASERRFADRLRGIAETEPDDRAQTLTQLARARGLQRRFAEAHETLDQAAAIAASPTARIRLHLERGRVFNSAGEPARAAPLFLQAWELARKTAQDGLAVDAAHMLGIVGPDSQAWNQRALDLAQSSDQSAARRWLASLLNNIGWTHLDAGRPDDALSSFQAALAERERTGTKGPILIARWAVARSLRALSKHDEALKVQLQLIADHAADGTEDAFAHEEAGENLLALGRADQARPHFARALALLSADAGFVPGNQDRLQRIARLADEPLKTPARLPTDLTPGSN